MDSVTICNMALSAIGSRSRIVLITEQSPEAAECNLHYEQALLETLRVHRWRWARRNAALAVLKARIGTPENPAGAAIPLTEPEWPWTYSYVMPTDLAKIGYIIPQDTLGTQATIGGVPLTSAQYTPADLASTPAIKFIESGDVDTTNPSLPQPIKVILTNQYQARLVYTAIITDPNVWDVGFRTALIGRLAAKICINLSGDKKLMQMAVQLGGQAEDAARAQDANDGITVVDWQPEAQAAGDFIDPSSSSDYASIGRQEIV